MVDEDGQSRQARYRGCREGRYQDQARNLGKGLYALDEQHPRLVLVTTALVGSPNPRLFC